MQAVLRRRGHGINSQPRGARADHAAGSLLDRFASAVREVLGGDAPSTTADAGASRIRELDAAIQTTERERCRDAGWYHQSLARRALDRQDWAKAEKQARLALFWDDTRAANFVALGESLARAPHGDLGAARNAFEAAFALEPTNSYVIHQLEQVYRRQGDPTAERALLRRAIALGAPRAIWEPELQGLERSRNFPIAS